VRKRTPATPERAGAKGDTSRTAQAFLCPTRPVSNSRKKQEASIIKRADPVPIVARLSGNTIARAVTLNAVHTAAGRRSTVRTSARMIRAGK
jgi:hypothetical protein